MKNNKRILEHLQILKIQIDIHTQYVQNNVCTTAVLLINGEYTKIMATLAGVDNIS